MQHETVIVLGLLAASTISSSRAASARIMSTVDDLFL